MSPEMIGLLGLGVMVALIITGVPIGFAAIIVGFVGLWIMTSLNAALTSVGTMPFSTTARYAYTVLPLFIMMGYIAFHAGLTDKLYRAGRQWVGWLPGGMASATVVGGAMFGAACGSSLAAAGVLSRVAVPEMMKYNYDRRLAAGCVAAVGTLSAVIPPSGLMVVYGIMTEQSIGRLLIAGILPGILIAILHVGLITVRARINPSLGPAVHGVTWKERVVSSGEVWPVAIIAATVVGGIYTGIFTVTEAGAAGALAALLIGLALRRIHRQNLWQIIQETGRTTSNVFIIIAGVLMFIPFFASTRAPYAISEWVVSLPVSPLLVLCAMMAFFLIAGCLIESVGLLVITVPVFYPAAKALGFDPTWFGILIVLMIEIGVLTPPVGIVSYAVSSVTRIPVSDVFRGVTPFILTMIVAVALIIAFPQIALVLPNMMLGK